MEFSFPKMTMAVMTGKWDEVRKLAEEGYPLNSGDAQSALRLACRCSLPTVELLFKKGADLNYSDPAETSTPLLSACYAGNLEIATFLVNNGARVNDRDELGNTPLAQQICGPNPSPVLISFLLKQGADPNTIAQYPVRPVIVQAKLKGLDEIVQLLLEHKANDEEPTDEEKQAAEEEEREYNDNNDDDEDQFVFTPNQIADRFLSNLGGEEDEGDDLVDDAQNEPGYAAAFALNQIGTSFLDYDGDCQEAIENFKQAIDTCPNYKNPYYNIWRAYKQDEQEEEAKIYAQKYKEKFGSDIEQISHDEFIGKQEAQRTQLFSQMPNVSTIYLGGNYSDSDDDDDGTPHA